MQKATGSRCLGFRFRSQARTSAHVRCQILVTDSLAAARLALGPYEHGNGTPSVTIYTLISRPGRAALAVLPNPASSCPFRHSATAISHGAPYIQSYGYCCNSSLAFIALVPAGWLQYLAFDLTKIYCPGSRRYYPICRYTSSISQKVAGIRRVREIIFSTSVNPRQAPTLHLVESGERNINVRPSLKHLITTL